MSLIHEREGEKKVILKTWKTRCLWVLFVLCFFVSGISCSGKEEKKARHLKRARQYVEKSELTKAVIEFRNVVQIDPADDTAHYELGEIYLKLNKVREAFQSFSRAVSTNQDNLKAQLKLGQIFLVVKKPRRQK